ncbi:MAG: Gfo/Idh/MocA family oxidoreductase [Lachnospiraceae bacterium]|nr:Gfo/Idh/MocA family oxidoreductase [Lachnospiraceae bacterium]
MKTIRIVLVGAGDRADVYAELALKKPEKMQVVGLVEPDVLRRGLMQEKYGVPEENCFSTVEEFVQREKFADAVINGTMDMLHVPTSVPVLEKGYDLLLEKPFCVNEEQLWELQKTAEKHGSKVMICHVLRYAPFYSAIKKHVMAGEIGDILSIQLTEYVSYHHMSAAYLRGKWANESVCGSPILLAKCCHDLDLMMWMMGGVKPTSVASFGSDYQFKPENKPQGAGKNCMIDCPAAIEGKCAYSARKNYLEPEIKWKQYVYKCLEGQELTYENCKNSLMDPDNIFGKCVWDCEHDVMDHQTVIVNFENGVVGNFIMTGGSSRPERNIHIIGTKGEIKGIFQDSKFVIRKPQGGTGYEEEVFDLFLTGEMDGEHGDHGGGDVRLSEDFVDYLNGAEPSISCTSLEDSIYSHLTVFRAEKSRKNGTVERVF